MHRGNSSTSKQMTMRPLNRNDGPVPSQRKRVSVIKLSSAIAENPQQTSTTASGATTIVVNERNPGLCRLLSNPTQTEAFMLNSGSSEESLSTETHKKPKDDQHLDRNASTTSSDSGGSSTSSDCGKDLVKRKRLITIKTVKCEPNVLGGDALAAGRRAVASDPVSSGSSSLTLVKNSASLIFTKKVTGSGGIGNQPVVHRKRDSRVGRRSENRCSLQPAGAVGVDTVLRKERTHSWYAPLYAPLDEEADSTTVGLKLNDFFLV